MWSNIVFEKQIKDFFFIFHDIYKQMKCYEQFYICLNKVLLLKLLQVVAICSNTIG